MRLALDVDVGKKASGIHGVCRIAAHAVFESDAPWPWVNVGIAAISHPADFLLHGSYGLKVPHPFVGKGDHGKRAILAFPVKSLVKIHS